MKTWKKGSSTINEKPTVLLVDDSPVALKAAIDMFLFLGCETQSAKNSKEAIILVRQLKLMHKTLSLAVFDIEMKNEDGHQENGDQLAKRVHEIYPSLRIFAVTSISKGSMNLVDQSDLDGLFQKPLDIGLCQKLLKDVKKVC